MERQGGKPLLAADHFGNLHQMVVHDVGQVVGRELVGPFPEDLVIQGIGVHGNMSADQVVHLHDPPLGHLEPDGPMVGLLQQALDLPGGKGEGVPHLQARRRVVDKGLPGRFGFLSAGVQLLGRVEGVVGPSGLHQLVGVLPVDRPPLALAVGGVGMLRRRGLHDMPFGVHALIGNDAAPVEGLDDVLLRPRDEPVGVGIFDPENEVSAFLFGV